MGVKTVPAWLAPSPAMHKPALLSSSLWLLVWQLDLDLLSSGDGVHLKVPWAAPWGASGFVHPPVAFLL